jgi:hypothetical protein
LFGANAIGTWPNIRCENISSKWFEAVVLPLTLMNRPLGL